MPTRPIGGKNCSVIYLKIPKGEFFKLSESELQNKSLKYNLQKKVKSTAVFDLICGFHGGLADIKVAES